MEWLLIALAVAVLATIEGARRNAAWRGVTKLVASSCFLVLAWWWGAFDDTYGQLIFAGLGLSWVGDALLISKRTRWFLAGLVAFLGAHVVYTAAFSRLGIDWGNFAIALLPAAMAYVAVHRWLMPHTGRMQVPVVAYMVAILAMVTTAFAVAPFVVFGGAALFALSDLFVARQRFIAPTWTNRAIGLPLYYAGQVLLAWSVV